MSKMNFGDVWRVVLIYVLMLVVGIAIVAKIIIIQTVDREELLESARKADIRIVSVPAVRGNIFSKNGTLLATTIPVFDIHFDPVAVPQDRFDREIGALSDSLARMLKTHTKSQFVNIFTKARNNNKRYVKVARKLKMDEYERLKTFPIFKERLGNGLIADKQLVRERPYGDIAMRVIGYVNYNDTLNPVKVGLEGAYDTCLSGRDGVQMRRRINGGRFIDVPASGNVTPSNGKDIYTSIDAKIQDVAEESLRRCLDENKAQQGCVIMMDVKSGFIEVMASLRYNEKKKKYEESYNFAIAENVEPGSTFKAITMTALLENDPNFNINRVLNLGTTGKMRFHNRVMTDSHVVGEGHPTIKQCFWESSNIAFGYLTTEAFESNPQRFIDLIYKTKINEPLNLDIKGEGKPYIKSTSSKLWSKVSLPWMSIGYEETVTPITLLTYYNAIANDGKMVKPQFVKEIRRGNEVVKTFDTIVINEKIASDRTIKTLQELLRGVVENGTAKLLKTCAFPVAGKTGTAQIAQNGNYNKKNYTASFVGYFPADDPKYTCIVVISNPMGGKYYGASVSAPVFKEIAEKVYATELGITDETANYPANADKYTKASMAWYEDVNEYCTMAGVRMVDAELNSEWVKVTHSVNGGVAMKSVELDDETVPDLTGMNVMDAVYLIESMGWKVSFSGRGLVESQSVKAGTTLDKGKTITLKLK
ncbi:MAG: transpeptidase family protein [Bacteroidales bacterium]|nr:transpeptidase family protein [Bacteroidales bacterium]